MDQTWYVIMLSLILIKTPCNISCKIIQYNVCPNCPRICLFLVLICLIVTFHNDIFQTFILDEYVRKTGGNKDSDMSMSGLKWTVAPLKKVSTKSGWLDY